MEQLMNRLPTEIVDLILEYQGYHNWRNGKYICRLQIDDKYDAVKRRPIINLRKGLVYPYNNTFNVSFTKIKQGTLYRYEYHTAIYSDKIHWYMDIHRYYSQNESNKFKNHRNVLKSYLCKNVHYVFEHNEKQHLPVIHV
jgi:hypothetical protein